MPIEHPYLGPKEVAAMVRHRMELRHYFPDKYKTSALARGDEYLPDELEEYSEDKLDAIELERLRRPLMPNSLAANGLQRKNNMKQG
jgi:hypothetical protein